MRFPSLLISAVLLSVATGVCAGSTKTDNWVSAPNLLSLTAAQKLEWIDEANATIFLSHVNDIINATMGSCKGYALVAGGIAVNIHACGAGIGADGKPTGRAETPNFPGPNDYVVIHVVRWKDLAAGSTVEQVDKQNWYIASGATPWSDADYSSNNRIFGRKQVYLLFLNFNIDPSAHYSMRYDVKTTSKIPAFLDNLIQLGQIAGLGTAGGAGGATTEGWNENGFTIPYVPSDIQITATIEPMTGASTQLDSKIFDNEGKYHIDFSVGVPIKKISDISYSSGSNTIVPTSVSKSNLFALVNYYPWAVDLNTGWSKYPHLVGGVAMDSQPLHESLFAIGYGPVIAHFYGGALLDVKQLPPGSSCSATPTSSQAAAGLTNRICPEFSFGLNVAVGAIAQSLKSTKK